MAQSDPARIDWTWGISADGSNPAPEWAHLYGWCFTAWQYQPGRPTPWWLAMQTFEGVEPGTWVLRRPADPHPWAVMSDADFRAWQHPKQVPA